MRPQSSRYLCFATAVLLPYIAAAQPQIYVVNYPLQYFAERIAGDHATVVFPAPSDVDPAFWQPSVDDVLAYQQADVIFLNGANYAKWLSRVTLPRVKLVDTSAARGERLIAIADQVRHQHGPAGEHSHAGIAFTTWLDVDFAVAQAQVIAAELSARWPRHNATFAANFAQLQDELQTIDQAFADVVQQDALPVLLASHPVYQYFARRYGLDIESVTWEPDVLPGERDWQQLRIRLDRRPARFMLWEAMPLPATIEGLSELRITSVVVSPCGNRPLSGDFMTVMRGNVDALRSLAAASRAVGRK